MKKTVWLFFVCLLLSSCNKEKKNIDTITVLYGCSETSNDYLRIVVDDSLLYNNFIERQNLQASGWFLFQTPKKETYMKFEVVVNNKDTTFFYNGLNPPYVYELFHLIITDDSRINEWATSD